MFAGVGFRVGFFFFLNVIIKIGRYTQNLTFTAPKYISV